MKRHLLIDEVCARYSCTPKVIHDKTRTRRMPFLKRPGWRHLMFNPDHLEQWDNGAPLETVELDDGGVLVRPVADLARAA